MEDFYSMQPMNISTLPSIYGIDDEDLYNDIEMGEASFPSNAEWNAGNKQSNMDNIEMHDVDKDRASQDDGTGDDDEV
jgi:hypothetical protein